MQVSDRASIEDCQNEGSIEAHASLILNLRHLAMTAFLLLARSYTAQKTKDRYSIGLAVRKMSLASSDCANSGLLVYNSP